MVPPLFVRRRLHCANGMLQINAETAIALNELRLERCPTAGLYALVAHHGDQHLTLATWVSAKRADQLISWLNQHAGSNLPQVETPRHRLDC